MAVGSGIGSQGGVAEETAYGTYVAPGRFPEIDSATLKKVKNTVQSDGLASGRLVELGAQRAVTTRAAAGDIAMTVPFNGFGIWLRHLFGGTAAPLIQGAGPAYLQTHILADNIGKSLTWQTGVADTGGVVRPYTFLGSKIMAAEFSCGVDELLKVKLTLDSQDVVESQTIAAPSYLTGNLPFHFGLMSLKAGTYNSEAAVTGVRKVTIKLQRPQNTSRFYANASGLKAEPIMNDRFNISGSIDVDFVNKADFADRFAADSNTSLLWQFTGPTAINSTFYPGFGLQIPMAFFDGDGQTLDGMDVQTQSYPFVGKNDGTNSPVTATYMSTDMAV